MLPVPFMRPEIWIVDRGKLRLEWPEAHPRALKHNEEGHVEGDDRHDGCEKCEDAKTIVACECGLPEHERDNHCHALAGEEDQSSEEIVRVRLAQPGETRILIDRRVDVAISRVFSTLEKNWKDNMDIFYNVPKKRV